MSTCKFVDDHDGADSDRCYTRTDPIIVEVKCTHEILESGHHIWDITGRAYPGVESGRWFSAGGPVTTSPKEHFDHAIESEMSWLRNAYPKRSLKLKVTRSDVRQLTLGEVA
jgi:hypothetical protein